MKKILILLLLFGTLGACKKGLFSPKKRLPAATQIGANTGGCLVNGEVFLGSKPRDTRLNYLDGQNFGLVISNKINDIRTSILIVIRNTELEAGKTYQLTEEFGENTNTGRYMIQAQSPPSPYYYETKAPIVGEVTITAHNFGQAYLSGTFWFDAVNSEGDIVEIREGRFDMDY